MTRTVDGTKRANPESEDGQTEEQFLETYKKKTYPKPSLTADIAVFRRSAQCLEVLLVRRGRHPYRGCWALPGGFVGQNEDVIDAAQRELEEETGVAGIPVELFGVYGTPGRDPRGWTVSGGFCAVVDDDVAVEAGDDAADARWCTVNAGSPERLSPNEDGQVGEAADSMRTPASGCETEEAINALSVDCGTGEALFVSFQAVPQRFGAPRAHVVDSYGFAFDHAQLLADAYLKVTQSD